MFNKFVLSAAALLICSLPVRLPAKPAAAEDAGPNPVIAASNAFAFKLYKRFAKDDSNIFFSPYSITEALSMTMEGARGETAAEMGITLGMPGEMADQRKFFAEDAGRLGLEGIEIANAFWAQNDHRLLSRYVKTLKKYYNAEAFPADFATSPELARLEINAWTSDRTRGKIQDLFPKDSLTNLTRLVLVDAVYFKGDWARAFNRQLTGDADFFVSSGNVVKTRMMSLPDAELNYAESDGLQILEMPYRDDKLSMLVLLPGRGALKELEGRLTPERLTVWKAGLAKEHVDVYFPRFVLNAKYNLPPILAKMGMPRAFTPQADFSGMDGNKDLYIQQAVHQGYVEVDEEGTEAAAATGVSMSLKSMPMPPAEFRADRPFLFFIMERATGLIVFMGRVQNP